jgi:AcrR family transcriptional regulator
MPNETRPAAEMTGKEAKYQQRYGEMLDAAALVFSEKGYHGASTKDIADQLGIRQGSLYYYFSSKQEALAEVCKRGVDGFNVRFGVRPYVKVFLKDRKDLEADNRRKVGSSSRAYETAWQNLVEAGAAAGVFRDYDPRRAVLGLLGMMNGTFDWFAGGEAELAEIGVLYADLFLNGLGA